MNKTIKAKWLAALKSGKYPKTDGDLRDGQGYCCLGVLCDIYRKETGDGKWKENRFITSTSDTTGYLPNKVMKWAGLSKKYGIMDGKGSDLTDINDQSHTFNEVIEVIEKRC